MKNAHLSMIPIAYGSCQTELEKVFTNLKRESWVTFYDVIISLCSSVAGRWMPLIHFH